MRSTRVVCILIAGVLLAASLSSETFQKALAQASAPRGGAVAEVATRGNSPREPLLELAANRLNTIRFRDDDAMRVLGIATVAVQEAPPARELRLPGSLSIDPAKMVRVHSRFTGEAASIGQVVVGKTSRGLRVGDQVKKGDLLATVWSKDIGEKKSELVDALSRQATSRLVLERLESVDKGLIAERQLFEARRELQADTVAVMRAERTLRSWRLADSDIEQIKREFETLSDRKTDKQPDQSRNWAETEIRAAIDGTIVEKNFNVGDIIDNDDILFKIADLTRLQVIANVYAEDLSAVRDLPPEQRKWSISLKSSGIGEPIPGTFEIIGNIIDPAHRTGVLLGWIDNPELRLSAGQFLSTTILLPADPDVLAVPDTALIEEGDLSAIFVQTDPARQEYTRRHVAVVRRGSSYVMVSTKPAGARKEPVLRPGDRVVTSGVLGLHGELSKLTSQAASR